MSCTSICEKALPTRLREFTRLLYIDIAYQTMAARITRVMIVPTSKLLPDSERGENTLPPAGTLSRNCVAVAAFVMLVALPGARRLGRRRHGSHGHAGLGRALGRRRGARSRARGRGHARVPPHRRRDEHVQARQRDLARQRARRRSADGDRRRAVRARRALARALGRERRRLRHHLRQRRLSRTTSARANGRPTARSRSASAPSTTATSCSIASERTIFFKTRRRPHQPRRHRERLRRRARGRRCCGRAASSTRC